MIQESTNFEKKKAPELKTQGLFFNSLKNQRIA
jgi:hypothetical protein